MVLQEHDSRNCYAVLYANYVLFYEIYLHTMLEIFLLCFCESFATPSIKYCYICVKIFFSFYLRNV